MENKIPVCLEMFLEGIRALINCSIWSWLMVVIRQAWTVRLESKHNKSPLEIPSRMQYHSYFSFWVIFLFHVLDCTEIWPAKRRGAPFLDRRGDWHAHRRQLSEGPERWCHSMRVSSYSAECWKVCEIRSDLISLHVKSYHSSRELTWWLSPCQHCVICVYGVTCRECWLGVHDWSNRMAITALLFVFRVTVDFLKTFFSLFLYLNVVNFALLRLIFCPCVILG